MDEFYVEQIVKKEKDLSGVVKTAFGTLSVVLLGLWFWLGAWFLLLCGILAVFVGCYIIAPRFSVEYEYLYLDKSLTVDIVMDKTSRKRLGEWDLNNMEVMARSDSDSLTDYRNRKSKIIDCSSGAANGNTYAVYLNDKDMTCILIEPNEELLKGIYSQFPSKVERQPFNI